jgi:outer membrane protein assembly factor BamB/tetratricopeptide (TPR) repeat protein
MRADQKTFFNHFNLYDYIRFAAFFLIVAIFCLPLCADENSTTEKTAKPKSPLSTGPFILPDRETIQHLNLARSLLQTDRHSEAIGHIDAILALENDTFFPKAEIDSTYSSLKTETTRLIESMGPEAKKVYSLFFDAPANEKLSEAIRESSQTKLTNLIGRYPKTPAAERAKFLLALNLFDRGHLHAGAELFEQLRLKTKKPKSFEPTLTLSLGSCLIQTDQIDLAKKRIDQLREQRPTIVATFGDQTGALFVDRSGKPISTDSILKQLKATAPKKTARHPADWTMAGRTATRDSKAKGHLPLLWQIWSIPTTDHPLLEQAIDQQIDRFESQSKPISAAAQPLAIGNTVLTRTAKTLLAIDIETGKRVWEIQIDDPLAPIEKSSAARPTSPLKRPLTNFEKTSKLINRLTNDTLYGSISADPQRVYSIEGLDISNASINFFRGAPRWRGAKNQTTPPTNRLAAHDIKTGKRLWQICDLPLKPKTANSGTFFLGAPLPIDQRLYVLAEKSRQIKLLTLVPSTGEILDEIPLAISKLQFNEDPLRMSQAISPAMDQGVLICPIGDNSLVAIEPATGILKWAYQASGTVSTKQQLLHKRSKRLPFAHPAAEPILDGGHVFFMPYKSDLIHCLDLKTGKPIWKSPTENDLYMATVTDDRIILIGYHKVRSLDRKTGKLIDGWPLELPEGATPSGTGFLSGDDYFLPLSTGTIIQIDTRTAKIKSETAPNKSIRPGNLICHKNKIISQTLRSLDAFFQLAPLTAGLEERLKKNQHDLDALRLRSAVAAARGNLDRAIADQLTLNRLDPSDSNRERLGQLFLDGLQNDFAKYIKRTSELSPLFKSPEAKQTYLRILVNGYESTGNWRQVAMVLGQLVDKIGEPDDLIKIPPKRHVRSDRWMRTHVERLVRSAGAAEIEPLNRRLAPHIRNALKSNSPNSLDKLEKFYGPLPLLADQKRALIDRLWESGQWIKAQWELAPALESTDPARSSSAWLWLAKKLTEARRYEEAARCYQYLTTEMPDAQTTDRKTIKQIVQSIPADSPLGQALTKLNCNWKPGKVQIKISTGSRSIQRWIGLHTIAQESPGSIFFKNHAIRLNQSSSTILIEDPFGKTAATINLKAKENNKRVITSTLSSQAATSGHLAILNLGFQIFGLDTLGGPEGKPRLLYSHNLNRPILSGNGGLQNDPTNIGILPLSNQTRSAQTRFFTGKLVLFAQGRNLVALEPPTGKPAWVNSVGSCGGWFGSAESVFAFIKKDSIERFRQLDGKVLDNRKLTPNQSQPLALLRDGMLVWRYTGGQQQLTFVDPKTGKPLWKPIEAEGQSHLATDNDQTAALIEPSGRLMIIDLRTGKILSETKVKLDAKPQSINLIQMANRMIVVVDTAKRFGRPQATEVYRPLSGFDSKRIESAKLFAFDRQGTSLWNEFPGGVTAEKQYIPTHQPPRLPILTLVSLKKDPKKKTGRWLASLMVIDIRNGRTLIEKNVSSASHYQYNLRVTGDPTTQQVNLSLGQKEFTFTFTDQPIGPATAQPTAQVNSSDKRLNRLEKSLPPQLRAILQTGRKMLLESIESPQNSDEGGE